MVFVKRKGKIMKADQDEKFIRKMKMFEIAMVVAVIVLCATLILSLADGDWLDSIANVAYLMVVYEFFKQMRTTRMLMHYINILETERDYNEKRIAGLENVCRDSEELITDLKKIGSNNCEIIESQERIIKLYEHAAAENAQFIPSEGE